MAQQIPDSNLVNYIWTYLHQGYTIDSIRGSLKKQGYKQKDINFAVDYIYANYYYGQGENNYPQNQQPTNYAPSHKEFHAPHAKEIMFVVVILFGVMIMGTAFVFILGNNASDVSIPEVNEIDIYDYEDPVAVESDDTPPDEPVESNEDTPRFDGNTNSNTQNNNQVVTQNRNTPQDIKEKFDASKEYTRRQIDLKVDYFSQSDPKEATKFCDILDTVDEQDFCYIDVAKNARNSGYCTYIKTNQYKDTCYFEMVLDGIDNNVCSKIANPTQNKNCNEVVKINNELEQLVTI
jgi:hypothetical protein